MASGGCADFGAVCPAPQVADWLSPSAVVCGCGAGCVIKVRGASMPPGEASEELGGRAVNLRVGRIVVTSDTVDQCPGLVGDGGEVRQVALTEGA